MASVQEIKRGPGVGFAVVSLCLVQFVDVLGVTVVVTALAAMLASLHAPESYAGLIATGYAMFFGSLLMLGARLGDRFGHRRTIIVSLVVFAAGAVTAAGASGFVVGGIVTDLTSWRFVFWAFLPLAAGLAAAIVWSVPRDRDADPAKLLNLAGAATFAAAVMTFVVGTTLITQPARRAGGGLLLAICPVLAAGFLLMDRRAAAPLLPARLLRSARLRQGTGGGLSAALLRRYRPQFVVALGLAGIAAADLALLLSAAAPLAVPACAAAAGAGIGLSSVAATGLGTDVEARWRGSASGIINTTAQLGTAVGTAVLLLVAAGTTGLPAAGTPEPAIAWSVAAAVAAAGAVFFAITGRRRRHAPDRSLRSADRGASAGGRRAQYGLPQRRPETERQAGGEARRRGLHQPRARRAARRHRPGQRPPPGPGQQPALRRVRPAVRRGSAGALPERLRRPAPPRGRERGGHGRRSCR